MKDLSPPEALLLDFVMYTLLCNSRPDLGLNLQIQFALDTKSACLEQSHILQMSLSAAADLNNSGFAIAIRQKPFNCLQIYVSA